MKYTKEDLQKSMDFLEQEILDAKIRINKFGSENDENKYHPIARIVKKYRTELKKLHFEMMDDLKEDFNE